jgi:hypothetical protein
MPCYNENKFTWFGAKPEELDCMIENRENQKHYDMMMDTTNYNGMLKFSPDKKNLIYFDLNLSKFKYVKHSLSAKSK